MEINLSSESLCRICFRDSEATIYKMDNFSDLIFHLSGVNLVRDRNFSNKICRNCAASIISAGMVRIKCIEANRFWLDALNQMGRLKSIDQLSSDDEEEQTTEEASNKPIKMPNPPEPSDDSDDYHFNYKESPKIYTARTYTCADCNRCFATKDSLRFHLALGHDRSTTCEQCQKSFSKMQYKQQHVLKVHCKWAHKHVCERCGVTFVSANALREHAAVHSSVRRFACDRCSARFKTKQALSFHRKRHEGARPLKCSFCAKRFLDSSDRKRHEYTHTGAFPHRCRVCGKGFARTRAFEQHLSTHDG